MSKINTDKTPIQWRYYKAAKGLKQNSLQSTEEVWLKDKRHNSQKS